MNIFVEFCSNVGHPAKLNKNIQQSFQCPIELSPWFDSTSRLGDRNGRDERRRKDDGSEQARNIWWAEEGEALLTNPFKERCMCVFAIHCDRQALGRRPKKLCNLNWFVS